MILMAALVTFIAVFIVLITIAYTMHGASPASERLDRIWNPALPEPEKSLKERHQEQARRVFSRLGKILPASSQRTTSRLQRLLLRAGFRRPESVLVFRGVKLVLVLGALAIVYLNDIHRVQPLSLVFAPLAGFVLPDLWLHHHIRRRQHRLRLALPDSLDLMVVCIEAGLGLDQALLRVSQELKLTHPELSEELKIVNMEMRVGKSRLDALRDLSKRTGVEDINSLVAMLIQTDRFGTSIAQSLRVESDSLRMKRRQRAEEAAAKTPVKMVPVLVFLIFPALLIVILGPAIITMVRQLLPIMNK